MAYIVKRMMEFLLFFLLLSFVSFVFIKLAPGDPVKQMLRVDEVAVTKEQIESLREELKLNEPLYVQYWYWLKRFFQFDLGHSYMTKKPVFDELLSRFPATVMLTCTSLMVMVFISAPLGTLSALYKNKWIDHASRLFALVGSSIPSFWLGLILMDLFAVKLNLLPSMGKGTWKHLILPSLTLGIAMSAAYVRLLRSSLLESFHKDYVKAARSRGISEKRIFFFHVFRHSLIPVITIFGMSLGSLISGTVVIEVLFSYPGIGKLIVDAIVRRDYPVIQGYVLFISLLIVMINIFIDICYRYLNPEIRLKGVERR
ncbi:peptide/nickel transport system permease protein [Anoxybacillus vitaminiphilus]|uniref:Nickel import system permease protein NikB n=1 Tax=Paranoxybacillus vitaminiphilus TaxID=581036 RepID=A0A327YNE6_9BACL|nr:nickel ABC transporter permease [Anoxybacillus vitaminiphilus]RAK22042.1 peptide/nickel transport system permease protein [Anoxybacillus vitaminiphilus]